MEEINRSGGNSGACHGQMYNMGTLLRHGSEAQKREYLPRIATGELRLQSMGVTEPTTGTDTTKIKTTAVPRRPLRDQRPEGLDLARAALRPDDPAGAHHAAGSGDAQVRGHVDLPVDLHHAIKHGMTVRPIPNMVNHETNELFFDNLEIPVENLIGEEGKGFKYILDGLNAERTLIAAECIGDGYWFIDKVAAYAKERTVFGRPIGQNQGVQFPIARAYVNVEAANLMRFEACRLFDAHEPCGAQANMAAAGRRRLLGSSQRLPAVPRRLRLRQRIRCGAQVPRDPSYQVAPISTNLILSYVAEHILGLPAPSDDDKRLPHPHLSAELAAFAAGLRYEDIPAPVLRRAEDLLLDCLASILAGASAPAVLAIERYAAAMGPADGPSEVLITRRRTTPLFAAMVNAAAAHVVEQDDVHNGSVFHPAAVVFPPALAVAQTLGRSGRDLLTAAVAGYEVGIRVGEFRPFALQDLSHHRHRRHHRRRRHRGPAAEPDAGQMLHALGSAGTQAAGLWEFLRDAADSKQLHTAGRSRRPDRRLPARDGFTGARHILEGPQGMAAGMSRDADPSAVRPAGHALGVGRNLVQVPRLLPPHASGGRRVQQSCASMD